MFKREASESPLCLEPIANKLCDCVSHVGQIDVVLDGSIYGTRRMHLSIRSIRFGILLKNVYTRVLRRIRGIFFFFKRAKSENHLLFVGCLN